MFLDLKRDPSEPLSNIRMKKLFKKHVEEVLSVSESKQDNKNIAFLKSWNEWGEGNYMEPDLRNGTMLIDTLQNITEKYDSI